jgi:hypothetical protein
MAQINELLRVLTIESNLVRRLTQVRRTQHAGVAIGHIKSTRVTCIPVGIPLYHVGVRLLLYLGWYSGITRIPSRESSLWTTGETACGICTWRMVLWNSKCGIALELPQHTGGGFDGVCLRHGVTSLGEPTTVQGPTKRWATSMLLPTATPVTAAAASTTTKTGKATTGFADIECNSILSFNELVHSGMLGLLRHGKLGQLHLLTLTSCGCCCLGQLALVSQGGHLNGHRVGQRRFVVAVISAKDAKCILMIHRGVSMASHHWCRPF